MAIIRFDGEVIFCETIEIGILGMLVDGHLVMPVNEVIRIVSWEE